MKESDHTDELLNAVHVPKDAGEHADALRGMLARIPDGWGRRQAAADALGLLRAEGLEPSLAHQALAARWVAGEIDDEQFELLNLEQVRKRLAATAGR